MTDMLPELDRPLVRRSRQRGHGLDSLDAHTLSVQDTDRMLDTVDVLDTAHVKGALLHLTKAGVPQVPHQGLGVVHPFVRLKVLERKVDLQESIAARRVGIAKVETAVHPV